MADYDTTQIRNLALLGHGGAGKTSLLEALLVKAGVQGEAGSLERGSTVSDFDPLEKQYQHSLNSALASIDFEGTHLNIIDTPGDPDFRGQALAAMSAVETAVIVINASNGIETSTRRLMRRARQRKLCRVIVINRMDAEDADLEGIVREIREEFGPQCLPINLPCDQRSTVRDCFFKSDGQTDIFSVADAHTEILDQVVEVDEDLMAAYLDGQDIDAQALHDAFEASLRDGHLVPICFTSARTGAGCGEFLRFAKRLLPNPAEGNPPAFRSGPEGERVTARPDPDGHVLAHVFKISNDPYAGKLSIFRVYQGSIGPDSQLYVNDGRKALKVAHLYRIHGKDHIEVDRAIPGDIRALAKHDEIHYDAVLHDCHDEDHYYLKPIDFPQPMFGLAVEARTRGQEQKLASSLARLAEEDPCFQVEHNQELNETVIRGLGEMHLRIMLERMKARYNVEVDTRTPRIAYRETITRSAEGHYRHKKQTGGAGQFGEVFLRVRPLGRGEGFVFRSEVVGGAIPTNLIPAVEKGARQLLVEGAIAGFPLQDVEVVVYDGKHHPVDSKEVAFVVAGRRAFLEAVQQAGPQILEPIVDIEVTVPDESMGDVTGSLAAKRARIQGTDSLRGAMTSISASVPLSSVADFPTELKSLTGGEGRYTMAFSHYEAVPGQVQKSLVEEHGRGADDEA
ncbi:elongation factor G [Wenzhouxiangella marina]|uniref:Elongation factor G n=1 Tax=Wenzhouxiangella marina TaxID=1579979 RepID=A0A0K0XWP9_9GAMM|nr:elongation factor G [Wenzhouxiangella marina]AKS42057.1 elongation factor G [Wenzhouxiangella marina]MBB6086174.1 elongation factor G [Wenzhouxiangella marina]